VLWGSVQRMLLPEVGAGSASAEVKRSATRRISNTAAVAVGI